MAGKKEVAGHVIWTSCGVKLYKPSREQWDNVLTTLSTSNDTGWQFNIYHLYSRCCSFERIKSLPIISIGLFDCKNIHMLNITTAITYNTTLQVLWIDNCSIHNEGLQILSTGLVHNTSLTSVWITNDATIGDTGMCYIGSFLAINKSLKVLSLFNCNISDTGVYNLSEGLKTNCSLTSLNLAGNRSITSAGAGFLSHLFVRRSSCLMELYLFDTSITDSGVVSICESLRELPAAGAGDVNKRIIISEQHKPNCTRLSYYTNIKDKIVFV